MKESSKYTRFRILIFPTSFLAGGIFVEEDIAFLKYSPISLQMFGFSRHIKIVTSKRLRKMSDSNALSSRQGTSEDNKTQAASRNDDSGRKPPTTEPRNEKEDGAQTDPHTSQSTPTEQMTASRISTSSPRSDNSKDNDGREASEYPGINQNVYACEPCEYREIRCDGVRPMCNNCEEEGRRCVYL